ncbi:pyrroline-5-carboxylate reductase [Paenibacillus flagellatus]|uniref:Pyrroline-5-carboxylate reductase n=1 Tax=Paenibacillus flagellatus TaxID=2211139 RepID=A0A2V5KJP5_9BACL|nr:pyrroline-5-carboxylate reductase [Paenibacillus flagellatus]PYI54860.1 pyrroline-5-carboxylate reductase [Paenibacillus flagellatus]
MDHATLDKRIVFVGAGSMAEAILRGLIERRIADPDRIVAVNRQDEARLADLRDKYGIRTARMPEQRDRYIREADVVVLSMKPKDAPSGIADIRRLLRPDQLIVSVIAGLSIATIERLLGGPYPVVRTMPNTSSTIGLGATGISFSAAVSAGQRETGLALFRAIGEVCAVDEERLDIVTGVSGSGPAYIYYVMEAMIAAGVEGGLSEEEARQLTVQTVLGAAQMVKTTNESPKELRRKVTSPNGTTQAAIELMEANRVGEAVSRAVLRAAERAREMGAAMAEQSLSHGKQV